MKARINIVGKTIDRWIFRRMVQEISSSRMLEVTATEEPLPEAELYHFFRPQDAEAALLHGWRGRFVTTLHGFLPGATDYARNKNAYSQAEAVVAVSRDAGLYLISNGLEPHRVRVIHAGADPNWFCYTGWPQGHLTIGLCARYYPAHGRVHDNKGGETILQAMKFVAAREKEAMLMVVGTGWWWLGEALSRIPFPVVYYERGRNCTYEDYPRLYNQMDCLLIASKFEGGPVAAYEAMMCGRPLVSTAVGAVPELVSEGESGYIFPQGDARTCAELLLNLKAERDEWARGRWRFPAERAAAFTWARWRKLHEELYQELVECSLGRTELKERKSAN